MSCRNVISAQCSECQRKEIQPSNGSNYDSLTASYLFRLISSDIAILQFAWDSNTLYGREIQ